MGWVRCGLGTPSSVLSLPTPSEASGAIARFNTDLTENLLSAVAEFSASQASGTPTPASPIPIVGVDKVNVVCCGKNQLAKPFIYESGTDLNLLSECFFIKAGTYRFSFDTMSNANNWRFLVRAKDSNGNDLSSSDYISVSSTNWSATRKGWLSNTNITAKGITITLNQDCYIRVLFCLGDTSASSVASNQMLEVGSEATTFEPYNGTTALINLGGTYYGGSVDAVTGKITLTHRIKSYDKNSTWTMNTSGVFYASAPSGIDDLEMCNYFEVFLPRGSSNAIDDGQCRLNSMRTNINFKILSCETLEDFKTWLGDNTIQVVYSLLNATQVYASNTAEIPTLNGLNQVYADSGDVAVKFFETVGHKI